ncbi:MAG TPA: hypothetical protein VE263_03590 [Candidatus Angelobacter sp.]|nr:hypothetical protein [Candidatus Angelobacter sp.]
MKVRQLTPHKTRRWMLKLASLVATVAAVLFCAATTLAQQCANNISPGETYNFQQATTGQGTSTQPSSIFGQEFVSGTDIPNSNRVEAAAVTIEQVPGGMHDSGTAEIDYVFCVPGRTKNSQVTAAVSAQISWSGILLGASLGSAIPSVSGTLNLVDLGTDGQANNQLASQAPLNGSINTLQISPLILNVNLNGGFVNGGSSVSLQAPVTVGHMYEIQYLLECDARSGLLDINVPEICDFATARIPVLGIALPSGDYHSSVDSLSITLGPDEYGTLLGVKAEVDTLSAKISANDQDIAAAKLALEQENAQLLGLLNEIKSLLSALQAAPSGAHAVKADPPNRPASPRPSPRITPEQ